MAIRRIGPARNIVNVGLLGLVLSLSHAAPVVAGSFEDGQAAAKNGDYATALQLWRPLAESGDARAQYNLGLLYANGQGVPQDYVQAHMWFNLSAVASYYVDNELHFSALNHRGEIEAKMTTVQIAQAQALAAAWTPTMLGNSGGGTDEIAITQKVYQAYEAYLQRHQPLAFAVGADGRSYGYVYCDVTRCAGPAQAENSAISYCNESYGGNGGCALFA
jgi:TPR repeat protein